VSKKKIAKKVAKRKARPVDAAETKLQVEVAEVRASVEDDPAPVCFEHGCYAPVTAWFDDGGYCIRHMQPKLDEPSAASEPHVVSEPSTAEEIAASDNAVIREAFAKTAAPAREPYVPPPLADPPVLPDLTQRTLEFHTPPGRRGMYCDVAFALLPEDGVVVWRTTDRLAGEVSYALAAAGDLDDVQTGEVTSRAWYPATEEQHAAIANCEYERSISIDEAIEHWGRLQAQAAAETDNPVAQHRASLYGRTVESLVLEKQTGTPHCVDHLEPLPCKIHALARRA
jgi:hypothetical protein